MRGVLLMLGNSLLAGCGGELDSNTTEARNEATPPVAATPGNAVAPEESATNRMIAAEPPEIPGVAEMSPYRRREYERGYRDCRTGNFDRKRQGESYRIGCMAAEEARDAGR